MTKNQKPENKLEEREEERKATEVEALQKQLEECQRLRDEYLAGWQRAKADFLNYKKEERERHYDNLRRNNESWAWILLRYYDNLEKAKDHVPENVKNDIWTQGILQIESQLKKDLEDYGVTEIKVLGKKFDPNFHEVIEQVEVKSKEPGTIIGVLQKGYLLNGQLLRPAKVRVAKQPEKQPKAEH